MCRRCLKEARKRERGEVRFTMADWPQDGRLLVDRRMNEVLRTGQGLPPVTRTGRAG